MDIRKMASGPLLGALNSVTKYPSIPTLHALGDRGVPTDEILVDFAGCTVDVTEKIDGTNARILLSERTYAIGSRENLLTVVGDVLFDPAQGIVAAIRAAADRLVATEWTGLHVLFGEVYGGKVTGASKQYTTDRAAMHWRLFDVVSFDAAELDSLLGRPREEIATWREGARRDFWRADETRALASSMGLDVVPALRDVEAPPSDRRLVGQWLADVIPESLARIDATGAGKAEGVVVRTRDRSRIAKVRFDDYRKVK